MATLRIPEQDRTLTDAGEISAYLGQHGIWYRRFEEIHFWHRTPSCDHAATPVD